MSDFEFEINGVSYRVKVKQISGDEARVEVNGAEYLVKIKARSDSPVANPWLGPAVAAAPVQESRPLVVRQEPSIDRANKEGHLILAPISGVVLKVNVKPGDTVKVGDIVAVVEAMKMENNITAVRDGTVKEVKVQPGSEVQEGAILIVLSES